MRDVECPECGAKLLNLPDNPLVGEVFRCPECGVELEVISTNPIVLDLAPEVEEDWGE